MSARDSAVLYSRPMLGLAAELAGFPYNPRATNLGESRSRSCGSALILSCESACADVGMQVTACAVGQASAAIFARHSPGHTEETLRTCLQQLEAWLRGDGAMPDWPDLEIVAPARDFPGRHGAMLLPWKAALDALSKGRAGR